MSVTLNASTSSGFVQAADTSGTVEIQSNGTTKFTVATTGAYGQLVSGTVNGGAANPLSGGTSVDFTSIPSWVKRITVMFDAVSTNNTSNWLIQLGDSGGIENTGYVSVGTFLGSSTGGTSYTAGFGLPIGNASHVEQGLIILSNLSGNVWTANGGLAGSGTAAGFMYLTAGSKTLSTTLDRVRITTVNGTDTFDAGTINILYEG